MTEWTDDGIVLGARPFSESKAIVEVFARARGRVAGVVHGGVSGKTRPLLQPGNLVRVTWRARLEDQLGFFSPFDLLEPHAARAFEDSAALAALTSAVALVRAGAAERQAAPPLYDALLVLIESLAEPQLWPALYPRFELGLLAAVGYGLDLGRCALTGAEEGLAWVSPRTGRAASFEAGAPFADKLLRLPPFLIDPQAAVEEGDIADAFALAGYFLERRLFDQRGEGMPDARRRLIEALGRSGRL